MRNISGIVALMVTKPKPSDPVAHVRLYPKDHAYATRLAKADNLPLSTWIRSVIIAHLAKCRIRDTSTKMTPERAK